MISTSRAVASTLGTRFVGLGLGFVGSIAVTRGLGPEGRGQYSLLLTTAMILGFFTSWGVAWSNTILVSRNPLGARAVVLTNLLLLSAGIAPFVILAALLPQAAWSGWLPNTGRALLLLTLAHLLILNLWGGVNGVLQGMQHFVAANWISMGASLVGVMLQVAFVWALEGGVVVALACLAVSNSMGVLAAIRRIRAVSPPARGSVRLAKEGIEIGVRGLAMNLVGTLLLRVDLFLVGAFLGLEAVGIYAVGVTLAELGLQFPSALNSILFAKASGGDDVAIQSVRAAHLSAVSGLACFAAFLFLGRPTLGALYGDVFRAGWSAALAAIAGVVFSAFAAPLAGFAAGRGAYPGWCLRAQLVAFAVNVAANLILIPPLGLLGAGLATTISYAINALLIARGFSRMAELDLRRVFWPQAEDRKWMLAQVQRVLGVRHG